MNPRKRKYYAAKAAAEKAAAAKPAPAPAPAKKVAAAPAPAKKVEKKAVKPAKKASSKE